MSIREYSLGVADAVATVNSGTFRAELTGAEAFPLVVVVVPIALYLATRRLQTLEMTQAE
jgi:hypothetical protein